jgi:RimJ/RimL family protein N-acetyltransferase
MLQTNKTLLRVPVHRDKGLLLAMRNDLDSQSILMSRAKPNTSDKVDDWLNKRLSDEHGLFFIIADLESDCCVGFTQLVNIDFISRRGDLGIWIDQEQRGMGYGHDALSLLESYVRKVFNIRKIGLQVLTDNQKAISFYRKVGYYDVGILQEHFYINDKFHDVLLMEKKIYQ